MSEMRMPNAAYHSIFFGAPLLTPASINPKSLMSVREATTKMKRVSPIPIGPELWRKGTSYPENICRIKDVT
jgi:hypothetical protein